MKKKLTLFLISFLLFYSSIANGTTLSKKIRILAKLYNDGALTENQFKRAKSTLLEINKKNNTFENKNFTVRQYKKTSSYGFEYNELIVGDYRIYTHRPGGIKIRRISDNRQLLIVGDKMKVKYYNNSKKILSHKINDKKDKLLINLKNITILNVEQKYVEKHKAFFFRVDALDGQAFQYYIVTKNGFKAAINIRIFKERIEKAVNKTKIKLAAKYNISIEQINLILKRKKQRYSKELEKIISEKEKEIEQLVTDEAFQDALDKEISKNIGEALAKEFDRAIIDGMENEFIAAVNYAVEQAIANGISEAVAEAAISAFVDALARGKSVHVARAAADSVCGCDSSGYVD